MTNAIVSLKNISHFYQKNQVLNDINLQVHTGEVLGLLGHNGAGKTTMMKLILGIINASKGEVEVFGQNPSLKTAISTRRKIGYLPENVKLYEQLTAKQVLTFFARLKSVNSTQVIELLRKVDLYSVMNKPVKTYSKGMRQRLGLAQAFLGRPKLLLLDEPTVGLDPIATHEFYQSVEMLRRDGASIILCSHVLRGLEPYIDKALILNKGHIVTIGTLETLREKANLPISIQTQGIDDMLEKDTLLSPFLVSPSILNVKDKDKIATIKRLVSYEQLSDLHIESPSLESLYQYYLTENMPINRIEAV
ncbi:ABC transporter ATP-binding protein [Shewanella surugensis]|uniref:ABC transporter ATP-binding protein n=1 Tax=Shewanella surugensis TaxID=212020 RepID=A0ABT0L7R5_9GAMM|nr:ABC transporter ATP-binding protein [Shewanella surugensis]MCL1123728.1 ABC transporter ATP-binding protein [Shewanella surugensis]